MLANELKEEMVIVGSSFSEPLEITYLIKNADPLRLLVKGTESHSCYMIEMCPELLASISAPPELNPARQHIPLVLNGLLTIPLFHGTSSIFYESILKHGLGGINIIRDLGVIDLLARLVQLCDQHLEPKDDWELTMFSARQIASQSVADRGWNYRHGGVYLSPSVGTAARYAANKKYCSSEAIEYFMLLHERLKGEAPTLLTSIARDATALLNLVSRPGVPLVLRLDDVAVDSLRSEHGKEISKSLEYLERMLNKKNINISGMGQQTNFECTALVPVSALTIYKVAESYRYPQNDPPLELYSSTVTS
jgi:hypothetical protein